MNIPTVSRRLVLGLALVLLGAGTTRAADAVAVRQVRADRESQAMDERLSDVAALLRANMPFSRYTLVASRTVALPAAPAVTLQAGYSLSCAGPRDNLEVHVRRGRSTVLRTTVSLGPGRPLILGGFPDGESVYLLILTLQ